jgi:ATP-dependent DNA ligase
MNRLLEERRELLQHRVMRRLREPIRFSDTLAASAERALEAVRSFNFKGIIAKRRNSAYEAGRRPGKWVKFKVHQGQELVIGEYTSRVVSDAVSTLEPASKLSGRTVNIENHPLRSIHIRP